jgi:hypothetical protein
MNEPQASTAPSSDNLSVDQLSAALAGRRQNTATPDTDTPAAPANQHPDGDGNETDPVLSQPAPDSPDNLADEPAGDTETPETEATETPPEAVAPEPEAEDAAEPEPEHEVTPKTVSEFRKRIESKNRKIAELTAALEERQAAPAPESPAAPPAAADWLHRDPDYAQASAALAEGKRLLKFVKTSLPGESYKGADGKEVVIPNDLRDDILENGAEGVARLSTRVELARGKAEARLAVERSQFEAEARKSYPTLFDPKSAEFKEAAQLTSAMPWLKNMTNVELVLGRYLRGLRAEKAAGQPKPSAANPPRVMTRAANVAPKPESAQDKAQDAYQKARTEYEKTGSMESRSKMLALQRQIART